MWKEQAAESLDTLADIQSPTSILCTARDFVSAVDGNASHLYRPLEVLLNVE
jgi:hypothetical protein